MKRLIIKLFLSLCLWAVLPVCAQDAVPLPGKKWSQKGFFRVKPADYFTWTYGMVADGEYIEKRLGRSYSTRPDENRSSNFYQPDYIRYFLIKEIQRELSKEIQRELSK